MSASFGPEQDVWFDLSGGSYQARYGTKQTLTHDSTDNAFDLLDLNGTLYTFNGL